MREPTTAKHDPPAARSAPAQRAAHEPDGTLRRHATCSPAARLHTAARSAQRAGVPPSAARIPTRSMRGASCPKSQARGALAGNHAHPSLARGCPRRQSSLARLRALSGSAPPWGCGAPRPSLRSGTRQRHRLPTRCRAQAAHRCRAAPTRAERVAALRASVGVRAHHPAASAFCGRRVFPLTPFASVALRAKSAAAPPRSARTAPRPASANAFASLSPPRETSRSICLPIARSGGPILPPSCHSTHAAHHAPPAWKGSRCSRR